MLVIGIDPGLTGALALYNPATDALDVRDMPTLVLPKAGGGKRTELDLYALARILDEWAPQKVRAFIEQVGPTPQMGVTSSFSFGGSFWAARMACAAHFIPIEMVSPQSWKRSLQVKGGAGRPTLSGPGLRPCSPLTTNFGPERRTTGGPRPR